MQLKNPIHVLKGKNHLRYLLICLGIIFLTGAFIWMKVMGIFVFLIMSLIVLLFSTILFPKITLYNDSFVIHHKGIIKFLNYEISYSYSELETVEFQEGDSIIKIIFIHLFFRNEGFGPRTQADKMIIRKKNGEIKIHNRINTKEKFLETLKMINERIATCN